MGEPYQMLAEGGSGGCKDESRPVRRFLCIVCLIACAVIFLCGPLLAFACLYIPGVGATSRWFTTPDKPSAYGIADYEEVSFSATDALLGRPIAIAAVHFRADRNLKPEAEPKSCNGAMKPEAGNMATTVVVVHGSGSSSLAPGKSNVLTCMVKPLLCAGFNVLAVDMRNHGKSSDAQPFSLGYYEADDVLGAAKWLKQSRNVSYDNILLWGVGAGASAVSYAAARDSRIRALVAVAPPVSLGAQSFAIFSGGYLVVRLPAIAAFWFAWWYSFLSIDSPFDRSLLLSARHIKADFMQAHDSRDEAVPFSSALALQAVLESRTDGLKGDEQPVYRSYFTKGDVCADANFSRAAIGFLTEAAGRAPK